MSLVGKLIGFGFRQVIGAVAGDEAGEMATTAAGPVIQLVEQHFTDHSQALPKALARANDRAWQALGIALAGDGFLDQIKVFFASGDDKGMREQVRLFLQDKNSGFERASADFRKKCLADLKKARQTGLLSAGKLSPGEVGQQTANFRRYADPKGLEGGAERAMAQIADDLAAEFPNLGKLLRQRPAGGPPLLVAAFAYFFRREVETNDELARGLFFDGLRQLSAAQDKSFGEVNKALLALGDQFEQVFEQLDRIETAVVETHGAVLDIQAELQRLGSLPDEVRRLMQEVQQRVSQAGMHKSEVKPQHSFSIRSEDERTAVKQLLARFRHLPVQQQQQVPALLNGLGKLQFGSGDFDGARATFETVAHNSTEATAQAEAQFNAYRAALEEKKWDDALAAIQQAAALDAHRFAPFPMQRYQPKKLLGAGGFGAAFLCHDRFFNAEVVVKTLHDAALERDMTQVFREAQVLRQLQHPAIIGVRDCNFADLTQMARPYIVMDYFAGGSLESFIQQRGTLSAEDLLVVARQIAQGMQAAHQQDILHRDLKPDNVLICKEGSSWKVKIIDFGLALRKQTIETSVAARSAGNTILSDSVAGTVKYAPPEQMGEMKGVKPGPYSDVYAFGKMCCYALFKTTEPRRRQWAEIAEELGEMLERCIEQSLDHRLPSFDHVLQVLEALDPVQAERKKQAEARVADTERKRREQGGGESKQQELERLRNEGETKLTLFLNEALNRTQGKPTKDDKAVAQEICKRHQVSMEKAKQIVEDVRAQWQKANARDSARKPGEIITNSLEMKFAWVPPGTFLMGTPPQEHCSQQDETQHQVALTRGLFMGVHQVTQALWQAVMGVHASNFLGADLPVQAVSWDDCQEFCRKLSIKDGRAYRLPTEAEWEYACRAGTTTRFAFGNTISSDQANFQGNSELNTLNGVLYTHGGKGIYRQTTTRVGSFPANAWGLFDMHGNLWEWCADWVGPYPPGPSVDPTGPAAGLLRVTRGGAYFDAAWALCSGRRESRVPTQRYANHGFRVCFCLEKSSGSSKEIATVSGASNQQLPSSVVASKSEGKPRDVNTNILGLKFAWIPPGTFLMGSPMDELGREPYQGANETQHKVTLTKGFHMGIYPVTRGQFAAFVEKSGYKTQAEREGGAHIYAGNEWKLNAGNWRNPGFEQTNDHPVTSVSWNDAVAFAKWLGEQENKSFRLPTEAEWEYSCRAATTTPFHFGSTISTDQANYDGINYTYGHGKNGVYRQKTTSVSSFPPNAWGLHDMHGNVWEWCQDWYGNYPHNAVVDPWGPDAGEVRVLRGGCWHATPGDCRTAFRAKNAPADRGNSTGFRLCCSLL